ncbi:MAG: hypothetical protein ACTS4X_01170 [Candidatus Hodgkinia cicadicola]
MLFNVCCAKATATNLHKTSEDLGSCFGFILSRVIRKFKPFRYASVMLPINGSLVRCTLDLCGRSSFRIEDITSASAKSFHITSVQALLNPLTQASGICLNIEVLKTTNIRSVQEGIFKSIGMCLTAVLLPSLKLLT